MEHQKNWTMIIVQLGDLYRLLHYFQLSCLKYPQAMTVKWTIFGEQILKFIKFHIIAEYSYKVLSWVL